MLARIFAPLLGLGVVGIILFWFAAIACAVAIPIGWGINIYHLIQLPGFDPFTIKLALMLVGVVFPPLGALMGWFF